MSFRLHYIAGTKYGDQYPQIRYPHTNRPGFATREHAEKARQACPSVDQMEIVEESD
jgi:hypothetical protein